VFLENRGSRLEANNYSLERKTLLRIHAKICIQKPKIQSMKGQIMPRMTFIKADGDRVEVDAPIGVSIMEIAHMNADKVYLEGACEGSLACSTCHVVVDPEWYSKLSEATEDEEDMLDLAFGLTQTSRLGCQLIMSDELDGIVVRLPAATRNMAI
jgi:2Fe-2S ferredoxin